jgi:hypothetical protein
VEIANEDGGIFVFHEDVAANKKNVIIVYNIFHIKLNKVDGMVMTSYHQSERRSRDICYQQMKTDHAMLPACICYFVHIF